MAASSSPSSPSCKLKKLLNKALQLIRDGETIKAHHVLNAGRRQHDDSAIFHRIWSSVLNFYVDHSIDDNPQLTKCYKEAVVDSAKRATQLSPNNLDFSISYAKLLAVARDDEGIQEAIKECERALAVANPVDFSFKNLRERPIQETSDIDGIASRQEQLRYLLIVFKNSGYSATMKRLLAISPYVFKIRSHLKSLQTLEEWKDFLRLDVKGFKEKFSRVPFIHEALDFAKAIRSWRFWSCPLCFPEQHFADSESYLQHMLEQHVVRPCKVLKPEEHDHDLVDTLIKGSWDPIDVEGLTVNSQEWPLSNDPERKRLLGRIKYYIWKLATDKCLSMGHLDRVLSNAKREVKALGIGVVTDDQSTNCLRFLDYKKLQSEISFLESLVEASELGPSEDKPLHVPESKAGGVILDDSSSYIELDMKLLPWGDNTSFPDADQSRGTLPDVDAMLYWLFDNLCPQEKCNAWFSEKEARRVQARRFLQRLRKLYCDLSIRSIIDKSKLITHMNNLRDLKKFLKEAEVFKPSRAADGAEAFQELESLLNDKLGIVDARIMKILTAIATLERNLACISALDYLPLFVPVVQTIMPEALAKKLDELAKGNPEAASEETVEELLLKTLQMRLQENLWAQSNRNSSSRPKG